MFRIVWIVPYRTYFEGNHNYEVVFLDVDTYGRKYGTAIRYVYGPYTTMVSPSLAKIPLVKAWVLILPSLSWRRRSLQTLVSNCRRMRIVWMYDVHQARGNAGYDYEGPGGSPDGKKLPA